MNAATTWVIPSADLQVGTTLSFDLTDSKGNVLHKAGMQINDRLKDRLLKMNIHSVTVRGEPSLGIEKAESIMLTSYPSESVKAIQASLASTQRAVRQFVDSVVKNHSADCGVLRGNMNLFASQAKENVAATLAVISMQSKFENVSVLDRIANRSTKASLLGVSMSVNNRDKLETTIDIGLAGLLHDCSLLLHPDWFSLASELQMDSYVNEYRRHPLESAELLNGIAGVSRNAITLITQVHEQCDGSGYPRGLLQNQVQPGASMLNLVDAYLNLTMPLGGKAIVPADAMAYLCYHATQGRFCREAFQLLLQSMSIYPIGSMVQLDDESKAIVIQGNKGMPLQPIVRLLHAEHRVVNLKESPRSIVAPWMLQGAGELSRIEKNQMQKVLWRTDC